MSYVNIYTLSGELINDNLIFNRNGGSTYSVDLSSLRDIDNFVFVSDIGDFPDVDNNEIYLEDGVTYFITDLVDLQGAQLIGGSNTTIIGGSSENCILTSTGLTAGVPLLKSIWTTPIRHITIKDVDTAVEFDGELNNEDVALDWTGVNFVNVPNVGLIKDVTNFIYDKGALLSSKGLKFDGQINTIGLNNSLFLGDGATGSIIEILEDCEVLRRFRIIYSSIISFSNTIGVNVSVDADIPIEGYILDTVNFSGGGTYLSGVDNFSNKSLFLLNVGIPNTAVNGQLYMRGNTTDTIITNTTDFFKIAGVTTPSDDNEKYIHSNNRLTNDAVVSRKYLVQCTLSFNTNANNVCEFGFYDSKLGDIREPSITSSTANTGGRAESVTLHCVINHSQGDYIEIWARNKTATNDIEVTDMNLTITEFK